MKSIFDEIQVGDIFDSLGNWSIGGDGSASFAGGAIGLNSDGSASFASGFFTVDSSGNITAKAAAVGTPITLPSAPVEGWDSYCSQLGGTELHYVSSGRTRRDNVTADPSSNVIEWNFWDVSTGTAYNMGAFYAFGQSWTGYDGEFMPGQLMLSSVGGNSGAIGDSNGGIMFITRNDGGTGDAAPPNGGYGGPIIFATDGGGGLTNDCRLYIESGPAGGNVYVGARTDDGTSSKLQVNGSASFAGGNILLNADGSLSLLGGGVSIDNSSGSSTLTITDNGDPEFFIMDNSAGSQFSFQIISSDFYINERGVANWLCLQHTTGYFGINQFSPSYQLDVNGTASFDNHQITTDGMGNLTAATLAMTGASTAPASPNAGQTYFNSSDFHFYGWNGTAWKQLDN